MSKRSVTGGKRAALNMRTTREVRSKIEAAARRSGRSLVQEVEYRIMQSFCDDAAARDRRWMARQMQTMRSHLETTETMQRHTRDALVTIARVLKSVADDVRWNVPTERDDYVLLKGLVNGSEARDG